MLSGCGDSGAAPGEAATQFREALAGGDGQAACELLAPATVEELESSEESSCDEALQGLGLDTEGEITGVEIFGRNAQATFAEDVLFLTESDGNWLITAAGCTSRGERPYDCDVKES